MSTLFVFLSVIAFAGDIVGLLAPQLALPWLPPARRGRAKAVAVYALLALVFIFGYKMTLAPEEQAALPGADGLPWDMASVNATSTNATAGSAPDPVIGGNAATREKSGQNAVSNATQQNKSFMDQAQETITRAANATRDFGRDAAKQAGEIGSELLDGAGEAGQQLWDNAKEAKDQLLNGNN